MEVAGRATAGLQVVQFVAAVERGSAAAGSSSRFRAAASTCSSSADCCTLRSRLGLAGSGLPGKRSRRNTSLSSSSSLCPPKAGRRLSSAPVAILHEENIFSTIDTDDLEAETPALLAQCSDMDWRRLVDELHLEALHSVESLGRKALCLKALEEETRSWIHDRMAQDIEVRIGGGEVSQGPADLGWRYESAAEELRMAANLQAAQHLARSVDASFDWEVEAAELNQRVFRYGGAEAPEGMNQEQRLLHAWFQAQGEELESSTRLLQEALASTAAIETHDWQLLGRAGGDKEKEASRQPRLEPVSSGGGTSESDSFGPEKSWFGIGAAVAASLVGGGQGASAMDAMGSDPSISVIPNPESMEAATRAPSWLVPAVLAFPVVSYFAFSLYREKVNPNARVSDWMFSVVTFVIIANIVLMATIGVRLY